MLIHGSWLWRWEKHSKSVTAGEQSEWVMWVTVKVSFNISKKRLKWQVRGQSQNSAALGEFVYYQEGTHWLDTNLISSAENKSRGLGEQIWWQKGFHPACFLWMQRRLITQPEGCNSSLDCRPPSPHPPCRFHRNQPHGFNLFPSLSTMNLASPGDSFHYWSSQRERNPKSNPTGVHLDFKSHSPIKCAGFWSRKPPAQGEVSGRPNFETLLSVALWPTVVLSGSRGVSQEHKGQSGSELLTDLFLREVGIFSHLVLFMLMWTQGPPWAECTPACLFSLCLTLFCPQASWVSAVYT